MPVRAKFRVTKIELTMANVQVPQEDPRGGAKWETREVKTIVMQPVTGRDGEDGKFFASTPTGELRMGVLSKEAAAQFELDASYYISFEKAE